MRNVEQSGSGTASTQGYQSPASTVALRTGKSIQMSYATSI
jgi:hypothetical protein